ncbi:MAG TPA: isoprenyl transferase [Oligoflexia bacterium]|nr:isoprenyl transferase [Oligoflexia bacterium]HMR24955.1 isoprenyl transferase [Oligoflexia bacterium]
MWPFKKNSLSNNGETAPDTTHIQHLAIIMDGNGRWAKKRSLPRIFGHRNSVDTTESIIEACRSFNIPYLTLYAFSQQNWQRPQQEVSGLMNLLEQFLNSKLQKMLDNDIAFNTIGDQQFLPEKIQTLIEKTKQKTQEKAKNIKMTLTLALSYGGREEITRAIQKLGKDLLEQKITLKDINQSCIASYLDTHDLPDPDLIIRTSGEYRSSNFLPWQSTYSEYYFTPTLWPDFSVAELKKAIEAFNQRERRFGDSKAHKTLEVQG